MARTILHVIADAQIGGAQIYLVELLREQRDRGYKCVIVTGGAGPLLDRYRTAASRVIQIGSLGRAASARDLSAAWDVGRLARGFDLVHGHASKALLATVLSRPIHRRPVVWSAHGYDSAHADFNPSARRLLDGVKAVLARRCDAISVASPNVAERVRSRGIDAKRVRIIYTGVRSERFAMIPPPKPGEFVVGGAGRFIPLKGFAVLIEALALVAPKEPTLRAVLYGYGPEESRLRALIVSLHLESRVTLRPPAQDLALAFPEMNVVVVPSLVDSFPLVPCEAMAAGRPIVASSVGGLPDAFVEGEHGYLVPPGNASALSEALTRLAADPDRARAMGEAARRYAAERYSWARVASEYDELYQSVSS